MKTRLFNWIRKLFMFRPLEVIIRKLIAGKSSGSFIGKLAPNNYQYESNSIREFSYNGINLKVNISDYVGHHLYFGFKDPSNDSLLSLTDQGDIIIDIGANIGATALQLASYVENNGFVYGFEPDPLNYSKCIENIKLNHTTNILIENLGLGEKVEKLNMIVQTPLNRGGNRIKSRIDDEGVEQKLVNITTLDHWVGMNDNIRRIDLIKIDVEGYEMKVLQGGIQNITKFKPKMFIEVDDNNLREQNSSAKELIGLLQELGYKNILHSITNKPIDLNEEFKNCHFDIIVR